MQQVLLMCRPGFESDLAAEIQDKASACGVFGFVRARAGDGFVVFEGHEPAAGRALLNKLSFADVVFARQWLLAVARNGFTIKPMVFQRFRLLGNGCWRLLGLVLK